VKHFPNIVLCFSLQSLVIIGPGKFANPSRAARLAGELKQNLVDIFVMPVGYDPDVEAVTKVASRIVDNNVFMTTSPEALRPHLRALTKRICEGAERPKGIISTISTYLGKNQYTSCRFRSKRGFDRLIYRFSVYFMLDVTARHMVQNAVSLYKRFQ